MFRYVILTISLLLPLALSAETLSERKVIQPEDLRAIKANPTNYEGLRVQFRSIFVTHSALFDSFHTRFKEDRHLNLVVWDDQAELWTPEVRADAVFSLYYDKTAEHIKEIAEIPKYQLVDIVGEVVSSYNDTPWISVHSIEPVANGGAYSDASVFLLQQAAKLAADGIYDLAEQNFAAALESNLNQDARIAVLEAQARNFLAWGKFSESIKVLEEALKLHESWEGDKLATSLSELYYLSAKGYSEAAAQSQNDNSAAEGDDVNAADYFQKSIDHAKLAVALEPEHGDAFAILGIGLSGLEHYDEARTHCQRAILMRPSNAEIRWYLGRILDRQGDFDEAIEVLNRAIDLSPKDYRIHKTIALVHYHKSEAGGKTAAEDRVTSLREFDIAIRLNNLDPDLFYFSGLVIEKAAEAGGKVRIGRSMVPATKKLAADRYHKCVNLDDAYLPAVMALAKYYRGIEKHDEAVGFFKKALELAPEREELYGQLATYFTSLGRLADAYEVHVAYNEREPKHLDTLYALGNLSLQLKEYQRAADWHEVLVKQESKHAMAHADLSDSYVELGKWTNVVKHADAALALLENDADKVRVNRKKGIAVWAQDDAAKTLAALSGNTEGTKDIRVLLALGWAQTLDAATAKDAMATAKAATALDAKNAEAAELLAWTHYLTGDYAGAEKALGALELSKELAGYRIGMSVFKQGPARYEDAKPLLKAGKALRDRRSILRDSSKEISAAERAIRDHERAVAKKAAADKRAADAKAREDKKKAAAEQRRKEAEMKKQKEMKAKKKAAEAKKQKELEAKKRLEAKRKAALEKKRKEDEARKKAAEEKKNKK